MKPQHTLKFADYTNGGISKVTTSDMDVRVYDMFNFISTSIHRLEMSGFKRDKDIAVLVPAILLEHVMEYYRSCMGFILAMPRGTDIVYDGVKCLLASPDSSVHVYYNKLPLIQPEMRSKYTFSHPIF